MSKVILHMNEKKYEFKQIDKENTSACEKCCFWPEQTGCPILKDDKPCSHTNLCYRVTIDGDHTYLIEV